MGNNKTGGLQRLDKILANNGFGSRKDVKKLLHAAAVTVNGSVRTDPASHADPAIDRIVINGEPLQTKKPLFIMLSKPAGVLSATRDPAGKPTVIDILPSDLTAPYEKGELFPVGRLDIDTEGLLVITSDGEAVHKLTSPKKNVPKTYFVRLEAPLTAAAQEDCIRRFADGIHITADRGERAHDCKSAQLRFTEKTGGTEAVLTITEGKFHQVKRMFFAVGSRVVYLKRLAVGRLALDENLQAGEARQLTEEEISLLFE